MISGGILNQLLYFLPMTVIYRKVTNIVYMEILSEVVDRLGVWAVENAMKINPSKSKAVRFTGARVKDPLNYSLMDTLIPA
jgi:hypothetical protein